MGGSRPPVYSITVLKGAQGYPKPTRGIDRRVSASHSFWQLCGASICSAWLADFQSIDHISRWG